MRLFKIFFFFWTLVPLFWTSGDACLGFMGLFTRSFFHTVLVSGTFDLLLSCVNKTIGMQ